jgi:hypothetical protein
MTALEAAFPPPGHQGRRGSRPRPGGRHGRRHQPGRQIRLRLRFLQECLNGEGDLKDFEGGNHLAISPNGLNVYAAGTRSGTVASFRRDPASGKLKYLETLPDGGEGGEFGAAGIGISPDGRFVYVATEDHKAISVFRRESGK